MIIPLFGPIKICIRQLIAKKIFNLSDGLKTACRLRIINLPANFDRPPKASLVVNHAYSCANFP